MYKTQKHNSLNLSYLYFGAYLSNFFLTPKTFSGKTSLQTFSAILFGVCDLVCAAYNSPAILFRMRVCFWRQSRCVCPFQHEYCMRSQRCKAACPITANVNSQAHNFP